MGCVLDEGVWVKKTSYKPKIKHASPGGPSGVKINESQGAVLNSLFSEAQEIKQSLGVVVGDLHKCTELLGGEYLSSVWVIDDYAILVWCLGDW
ncbi:hypothetical protein HAX54_017177 [Datura stramonium]|uniref:Uncharacterized protein n=1 Tax=Datura stramonium TaxID=4076 RepID=A0ABS8Y5K3_DATST|nr:hypothetical protein [Datura stramonium]